MFEQCPACVWRMLITCKNPSCNAQCTVSGREVCCVGMDGEAASFVVRCLHCGHENPSDEMIARGMILPEILNTAQRKWEWEHPNA